MEGIGCVLTPGLFAEAGPPVVGIGARIRLRSPDGREMDTFIKDLPEIRNAKMPEKIACPVALPSNINKDSVPAGTEVFLLESN